MKGEYIETGDVTVEAERNYEISYSVRFVDGTFRCIARLRYEGQTWRYDPMHTAKRITDSKHQVQQSLQEVIDSCKDAIDEMEGAKDLDLSVTVE